MIKKTLKWIGIILLAIWLIYVIYREYYVDTTWNNNDNILPEEIITNEDQPSDKDNLINEDKQSNEDNLIDENNIINENKVINENESIDDVIDLNIDNTKILDTYEWVDLLGFENSFLKEYSTKNPEEVRKAVNIMRTKIKKTLEEDEEIYLWKLSCKSSYYIYCYTEWCECSDSYQKDDFERYNVIINETKWTKDYIIIWKKKKSASIGGINEEWKWISPGTESNKCPKWKIYQCPMWLCEDKETWDLYPCQHTCFCTDPEFRF